MEQTKHDVANLDGTGGSDIAPVTVVLAGNDIPLAGVRFGLERHGFSVVAEARDADEAVEAALLHRPQLCLLDVDMPGDGIDAADRIKIKLPETKIAILSGFADRERVLEAIRAGADGYLMRSTAPDRLTAALRGLINGEVALPRSFTGQLVDELRSIERRLDRADIAEPPSTGLAPLSTIDLHRSLELRPAREPLPRGPGWRVLYVPRLMRHFRRRVQSGMRVSLAWDSARERMRDYG